MNTDGFHLAQANIARMRAPLDHPSMADFVAQLEPVNALADRTPGFVWRLQTEDGDASAVRVFDDPTILLNMSVWETPDALRRFAYESEHLGVFRDRHRWFERLGKTSHVLWWIPAGSLPTPRDAEARFASLWDAGPTPAAFGFGRVFPPDVAALHGM